jgi:hypothetical protein
MYSPAMFASAISTPHLSHLFITYALPAFGSAIA